MSKRNGLLAAFERHLPAILLACAFAISAFFYGLWAGDHHRFPYNQVEQAGDAENRIEDKLWGEPYYERDWSDVSPADMASLRVTVKVPVADNSAFLLGGGPGQYLDYCPKTGCAAVILRRDGSLVHAYPFRPDEMANKRTMELPYQEFLHDDSRDTAVFGLSALANGDLIVVYNLIGSAPYGGGIARIDKDGHLLWFRRDYTNHWPTVTAQNEILASSERMMGPSVTVPFGVGQHILLTCPGGVPGDLIRVLGLDGTVKEEISIFDALVNSPFRSQLLPTFSVNGLDREPCDPLHTNSVNLVGAEVAAKLTNVQPDDFLVSMRNISALAIIGRADHKIKYLFKGTFLSQHSARIAPGGNIILFDNDGGSLEGGPSRVLLLDPATGTEKQIFPNAGTPAQFRLFSLWGGNISLSADGLRALVVFPLPGKALELRLSDGAVLTAFDNLHDVHTLAQFASAPKKVRYFEQTGVYYVPPDLFD